MRTRRLIGCRGLILALTAIALSAGPASAITYNLFAGPGTMTMPDGTNIPVWGYGLDLASGGDGVTVRVPGPQLIVPVGDDTLAKNLRNALPAPYRTSLVIPGQPTTLTPVWDDGATGNRTPGNYTARVMSFTHEAPNGGSATYTFTGAWAYEGIQEEEGPAGEPLIICGVNFDGCDTLTVCTLGEAQPEEVFVGMRVQLKWPENIEGRLDDIAHVVPVKE